MNIAQISNHISFNKIFSECKNGKGKIDWYKVLTYKNLPSELIDKYFLKLKAMNIETFQKLDDYIIEKYRFQLNWYALLMNQELSEEILRKNIDLISKKRLWPVVIKFQKPSLNFYIDNIEGLKKADLKNSIQQSFTMDESMKKILQSLLNS